MSTLDHWLSTWRVLGVTNADLLQQIHAELVTRYTEKHRYYHTLQHLDECFEHWLSLRPTTSHPAEVELALWFHDSIYDTQRSDNEARSAAWARDAARSFNLPLDESQRIYDLVMCTRHAVEPIGADAEALVDVDLAILGAAPARFEEYEGQIRREYAWVPETVFMTKRVAILEEFLARDHIYSTPLFRERFEQQARQNIGRSLKALRQVP